jgi:hypothetical protein
MTKPVLAAALLASVVGAVALAQVVPAPGGGNKFTTVLTNLIRKNGTGTLEVKGNVADGATAVGVTVDNLQTLSTAGARILSVRNNGAEKFQFRPTGLFAPGAFNGGDLGSGALPWNSLTVTSYMDTGANIRMQWYTGNTYTGTAANSAGQTAHHLGNLTTLTNADAAIVAFHSDNNNVLKKAIVYADGRATFAGGLRTNSDGAAKPTCNAAYRGFTWYTPGGAGVKDDFQVCGKDVADAYAWRTIY